MVADALQVLDDHEQIQGGIHLAGVGGDLLRQRMLDGVEIVVHLIVGGNDPEGSLLVLRGQGIQGIQDHLVRLLAHLDGLAHSRVALFADSDQMGDDLRDIGGMVADALHIRDHLHGGGDAAQVTCHRLLAEQQGHAAVLNVPLHVVDAAIALHHGGGSLGIGGAEGFHCSFHGIGSALPHLGQGRFQGSKVVFVLCTVAHCVFLLSRTGPKCNPRCAYPAGC